MVSSRLLNRAEAVAVAVISQPLSAAAPAAGSSSGLFVQFVAAGATGTRHKAYSLRLSWPRARHPALFGGNQRLWPNIAGCSNSDKDGGHNQTDQDHDSPGEYALAHVVDAVSMVPFQGQLYMTLGSGREVEVDHINPIKGRLLYRSRNPTIFLKIVEEELILPIVVGEVAVNMLIRAIRDEDNMGRPNHYQLLRDVFQTLKYEVRMVRVTERVVDTYYARIYFNKEGDDELLSVDSRPSDAINLAVRCKAPIYVNRKIIDSDAVRPVYASIWAEQARNSQSSSSLDSVEGGPDPIAEEITLLRDMLVAVVEERYLDAARCRDQLNKLGVTYKGKLHQP